jgi:hypothetical protein
MLRISKSIFIASVLALTAASLAAAPAQADTCSGRAGLCNAACTPQNVASGAQHGGTVAGCRASCQSRLRACLKSGVWVHMGSQTRGMRQTVDRR